MSFTDPVRCMTILAQALIASWLWQASPPGVEQLAWLAGSWLSASGETEEHWTAPKAGSARRPRATKLPAA